MKNPEDRVGSERFEHGKFNHYTCEVCKAVTITKHEDDGVTPFLIGCRATKDCPGQATSHFYRVSQDEAQQPHAIWFRAKHRGELINIANTMSTSNAEWTIDHHDKGGCLLRETRLSSTYEKAKKHGWPAE